MVLDNITLLVDFGLVVLIWIVQRIIYPSFLYYKTSKLLIWHTEYMARFSAIVIPLMLGQLAISIYQLFIDINSNSFISFGIIVLLWMSTFLQFVPIHTHISKGIVTEEMLKSLVHKNWIRTVLWTLLFLYHFILSIVII
ncbi:hypothetical protein PG913_02080 [Tenacibaculum pacificus]|uniref:hypothetical protein n=1 Tax=Tenacibaculum pacificus TaxID=3018314 RepID=UPI0022F3F924|nr:hypothetical protein [Tenacibaculum pacificus]WBX74053.1 hypothetical protein PG913_02080 [Tenacibaculum pacificus]